MRAPSADPVRLPLSTGRPGSDRRRSRAWIPVLRRPCQVTNVLSAGVPERTESLEEAEALSGAGAAMMLENRNPTDEKTIDEGG